MKWYSIGEFAAKTGVTPDFIKYYEKNGLLTPKVSDTGYRSYTAVRVSNVSECIKLKNMGFSAKEINQLLKETDFQATVKLLTSRRKDVEAQIRYLQGVLDYTDEIETQLNAYGRNAWHIDWFEDFYFLIQSRNFSFENVGNEKILKQWQKWQPNVRATARVDNRTGKAPVIEWGVSVPASFAEAQELPLGQPVEHIPAGRYLEFFDKRLLPDNQDNDNHESVRRGMFCNVQKILDRHSFEVCGPSYFIVQTKIRENGLRYTYQKVRVPIAN